VASGGLEGAYGVQRRKAIHSADLSGSIELLSIMVSH